MKIFFVYLKSCIDLKSTQYLVILYFVFLLPVSNAKDLQPDDLDLSIGELSFSAYIRLTTKPVNFSGNTSIDVEQQGSNNQISLSLNHSSNNVDIIQQGNSNFSDITINGGDNNIYINQFGVNNSVELMQVGNNSFTHIEQIGSYNQVIMELNESSQVNRVTQYGSGMKATIRN